MQFMSNPKKLTILFLLIGCLISGLMSGYAAKGAALITADLQTDRVISSPSPRGKVFLPLVFKAAIEYSDLRFAVIGDYGNGSQAEADVAALV
jgi:hypothetical protein